MRLPASRHRTPCVDRTPLVRHGLVRRRLDRRGLVRRRLVRRTLGWATAAWLPLLAWVLAGSIASAPLGFASLWAQGDASEPVFEDAIEVRRTELLVWVDARDGTPIRGLAAGDFELSVDGEPWPVLGVQPVALQPLDGASRRILEDDADRRGRADRRDPVTLLLVVDPTFLLPGDLHGVRSSLLGFLERGLRPGDLALLAVPGPSLDVPVRATDDLDRVRTTLADLEVSPLGGRFEREREAIQREIRRNSIRADQSQQSVLRTAQLNRTVLSQIDGYRAEARFAAERLSRQLDSLLGALGGMPGRKLMIYVGGRLPTVTAADLYESWRIVFGGRASQLPGNLGALESDSSTFNDLGVAGQAIGDEDLFEDLARRAAASEITVHTVNAAALRGAEGALSVFGSADLTTNATGSSRRASADARRGDAHAMGLRRLAEGTGGRALGSNRAFDDLMARIASDLETHYLLTYEPPARDDLYPVAVALRRGAAPRRARVRHRPLAAPADAERQIARRTLSALLLGEPSGGSSDGLSSLPPPPGTRTLEGLELLPGAAVDGVLETTLRIPLGRLALRPDGAVHAAHLTVFATAGTFETGAAPIQTARVPVRLPNQDLLTSLGRRAEMRLELPLPRGADRVAVTVRDDYGDRLSTLVVRADGGDEPSLPDDALDPDAMTLEVVPPLPLPEDPPPSSERRVP